MLEDRANMEAIEPPEPESGVLEEMDDPPLDPFLAMFGDGSDSNGASHKGEEEAALSEKDSLSEGSLINELFGEAEGEVPEPASSSCPAPAPEPASSSHAVPEPPPPPPSADPPPPEDPAKRGAAPAYKFVSKTKENPDIKLKFNEFGEIRYNIKKQSFYAVCHRHSGAGAECRRTRTALGPSARNCLRNPGQGRPLGLLAAWLVQAGDHRSEVMHASSMSTISRAQRAEGRRMLEALPGHEVLTSKERALQPGEPSEPREIQ